MERESPNIENKLSMTEEEKSVLAFYGISEEQ